VKSRSSNAAGVHRSGLAPGRDACREVNLLEPPTG